MYLCYTCKKLEVGGLQIHADSRKPSHGEIWKICCSPSLGKHMVIASAKTRLESTTSHAEVRDKRPEGMGKYGLFLSAVSGKAWPNHLHDKISTSTSCWTHSTSTTMYSCNGVFIYAFWLLISSVLEVNIVSIYSCNMFCKRNSKAKQLSNCLSIQSEAVAVDQFQPWPSVHSDETQE